MGLLLWAGGWEISIDCYMAGTTAEWELQHGEEQQMRAVPRLQLT